MIYLLLRFFTIKQRNNFGCFFIGKSDKNSNSYQNASIFFCMPTFTLGRQTKKKHLKSGQIAKFAVQFDLECI